MQWDMYLSLIIIHIYIYMYISMRGAALLSDILYIHIQTGL